MALWQPIDAWARAQKRQWFAEGRRRLKIAREQAANAGVAVDARAAKCYARVSRDASRVGADRRQHLRRLLKIARERTMNGIVAARNLTRKTVLRAWGLRRPLLRWQARRARFQEQVARLRVERDVEDQIARVAEGDGPIIVGPWLSEVGYEALYWVPFVRWFRQTYRVKPDRLTVVSRGGVGAWYADITPHYVEIFDLITAEAFARHNAEKAAEPGGTVKQYEPSAFERDLVARTAAARGLTDAQVLHPGLMYRLFQQFWAGNRPLSFLDDHALYRRIELSADASARLDLPAEYVAMKFYTAASLQDRPETRQVLRDLIASIAERYPVVLLDTGLALDDHDDYRFGPQHRVVSAEAWMTPRDNLGLQTRIIAGARAFVGTCGSIAWLAPMLGVDTIPVMTDDKSLNVHLHVARRVYRVMGAGRFTPLDLGALGPMGLTIAAGQTTRLDLA